MIEMRESHVPTASIIDLPVSALMFDSQIELIFSWAKRKISKFVCIANVHMLMEAHWSHDFRSVLESADLVTPDGMPLVWLMRLMGYGQQDRVAGLDVFLALCGRSQEYGRKVFFIGSTEEVLEKMRKQLSRDFPKLQVAGMVSPPFRPLTPEEDNALVNSVNSSGAEIIFVAFGCPKQEQWMKDHHGRINGVMIGVGAVFSVYAGIKKRAPLWAREAGLEWLYRLIQEPKRLWKRYGTTIPPFLYLAAKQIARAIVNNVGRRQHKADEAGKSAVS